MKLTPKQEAFFKSHKQDLQNNNLYNFYNDLQEEVDETSEIGTYTKFFILKGINIFDYLKDQIPEGCCCFLPEIGPNLVLISMRGLKIEMSAFEGCPNIKQVWLPDGVSLDSGAFAQCDRLTEVHFSGIPFYIDGYAFNDSPNLKKVIFECSKEELEQAECWEDEDPENVYNGAEVIFKK